MTIKGKAYIAGIYEHPTRHAPDKSTAQLHAEVAKENASFKKVNESMLTFTKNAYQWFQVAENTYDQFMIRSMRG